MTTPFMETVVKLVVEQRKISERTALGHVRILRTLNKSTPFTSFVFLKNTTAILERVAKYRLSSRKTVISSIISVLSIDPKMDKTREFYVKKFNEIKAEIDSSQPETTVKTEKESANWMEWDDVIRLRDELEARVPVSKRLSVQELKDRLYATLLSLYIDIPPRRNNDYVKMDVVRMTKRTVLTTDRNYLCLSNGVPTEFVFHDYKTAKVHGVQRIPIPDSLRDRILRYLQTHPEAKKAQFHFLVYANGSPIRSSNSMTTILNRIFGKNVGSSLLRHIYLSSKYGNILAEQTKDSDAMAHSLAQQKEYIRV